LFISQLTLYDENQERLPPRFKHFGILVTVVVHSIESGGKHFARHYGNPDEFGMALFDFKVHLFSTWRKNWMDSG
jgi:hypothetical protein